MVMPTVCWSCQQRDFGYEQSQAALSNADDPVLDAYNAGRMVSKQVDYLHGEITILQRDPAAIYVYLTSAELGISFAVESSRLKVNLAAWGGH